MKIVKCRKTTLKTPLTSTATSVKLDALVDSKDVAVVLASFGTWFVLVIKQGSLTEMIKCDGLTQNADGSATATVATSGRGLSPLSPYAGSATGFDFSTGAEVIVTNDPLTMAELAHLNDANTFTGINTFTETAMPRISASHSYGAGQEEYLATKRYADGVALAGAPDASITTKGVVEIQTQAEYEAGTTVGGTSAPLVVPASIGARFLSGYAVDAGANDTYVITLSPVPSAYFNGMLLSFKANTANTGACTLNVNALGAKALKQSGVDPRDNYIKANSQIVVQYDGTNFNILSVSAQPQVSQDGAEIYAVDAGANDTYVITLSPVPSAYFNGMVVRFKANTANTGACTLNVNGLGVKTIKKYYSSGKVDLNDSDIIASQLVSVIYDGTDLVMLSSKANDVTRKNGVNSRDVSTASGTQSIAHGLGVTPKIVRINAIWLYSTARSLFSLGTYSGATTATIYKGSSSNGTAESSGQDSANIISLFDTTGNQGATATITVDATNINIAWTKLSFPTGIAYFSWEVET